MTGWERPLNEGQKFHYITCAGHCTSEGYIQDNDIDEARINTFNAFSIKKKAQEVADIQLAYRMMKKFVDEWDGERGVGLWEINFNKEQKRLHSVESNEYNIANIFPSEACAKEFIEQFGFEYAELLGWELEE